MFYLIHNLTQVDQVPSGLKISWLIIAMSASLNVLFLLDLFLNPKSLLRILLLIDLSLLRFSLFSPFSMGFFTQVLFVRTSLDLFKVFSFNKVITANVEVVIIRVITPQNSIN